jgi:hypothetical protein
MESLGNPKWKTYFARDWSISQKLTNEMARKLNFPQCKACCFEGNGFE